MDLTGQVFSELTVLHRDTTRPGGHQRPAYWVCQCSCGEQTSVKTANLRNGSVKSCGHLGITSKKASEAKAKRTNVIVEQHEGYAKLNLNGIETLVDNEFVPEVMSRNWHLSQKGYVWACYPGKASVFLHRLIMNAGEAEIVDHINHDPLDNRRENLRICSYTENNRNTVRRYNNSVGLKGVTRSKNKFTATIFMDGKHLHLGTYDTAEAAHNAYCEAAERYFGEYACTGDETS